MRNAPTVLSQPNVSVEQAVHNYTMGSAYARFSEKKLGSLEAGKEADFVVLSQDIFTVAHNEIGKTHPMMTFVGGKMVFDYGRPR